MTDRNPRRFCFLVHPDARRGGTAARLRAAVAAYTRVARWPSALDGRVVELRQLDDARRAVARLVADEVPVAVGGDGTVALVVRALDAEGLLHRPLGVVPLGTGNALAHAVGVGTVRAALDALERGTPRSLDLLRTTHPDAPVAVASLSLGFEAHVMAAYGRHRRERGRAVAAVGAILAAARSSPTGGTRSDAAFSLDVDGEPWVRWGERVFNAGLYTLPCYAFGHVVFAAKRTGDGRAVASRCPTALAYARLLAGDPGPPGRVGAALTAVVESRGPVQVDGEAVGPGAFEVRVEGGALRVLGPAAAVRG